MAILSELIELALSLAINTGSHERPPELLLNLNILHEDSSCLARQRRGTEESHRKRRASFTASPSASILQDGGVQSKKSHIQDHTYGQQKAEMHHKIVVQPLSWQKITEAHIVVGAFAG